MDFINYYCSQGRPDLAQKVLDLMNMETNTAGVVFERYAVKISDMMFLYRLHLIGFNNEMTLINLALPPILMFLMPPTCVRLVYQRIGFIKDYINKNELFEMIPRFNELNKKLAISIKTIRSDADVSPLLSEESFEKFRKMQSMEIKINQKIEKH